VVLGDRRKELVGTNYGASRGFRTVAVERLGVLVPKRAYFSERDAGKSERIGGVHSIIL